MELSNEKRLEEKIKSFDFSFLKYINPETKELSNKVILFSCVCIFLNFGFLTISELEITGLKVEIKQSFLSLVLISINTYYFLQFINSIKIDILLSKIPNEHTEICEEINSISIEITSKSDLLKQEYENMIHNENFDEKKLEGLQQKLGNLEKDMENKLKIFESWKNGLIKSNNYHKQNILLNQYFPRICFIVSFISIIFYLYKTYFC